MEHTRLQYEILEKMVGMLIRDVRNYSGKKIFGIKLHNKVHKLGWYIIDLKFDTKVKA